MWRWNCFVFGAGRGAGERRIDCLYEVKVCIGQGGWFVKAAACIAENYPVPKDLCAAFFRVLSNRPVTLKFLNQHFGSLAPDPVRRNFLMTKTCEKTAPCHPRRRLIDAQWQSRRGRF